MEYKKCEKYRLEERQEEQEEDYERYRGTDTRVHGLFLRRCQDNTPPHTISTAAATTLLSRTRIRRTPEDGEDEEKRSSRSDSPPKKKRNSKKNIVRKDPTTTQGAAGSIQQQQQQPATPTTPQQQPICVRKHLKLSLLSSCSVSNPKLYCGIHARRVSSDMFFPLACKTSLMKNTIDPAFMVAIISSSSSRIDATSKSGPNLSFSFFFKS